MKIDELIEMLKNGQEESGEFKSFCFLPQSPNPIWYYTGDSPFVTANILFSIRNIKHHDVTIILTKGLNYLKSLEEKNGLYRYWKHNNGIMEYNVPCDIDDTSLVYFLKKRFSVVNKGTERILLNNRSLNGHFLTWFRPTMRHLFHPKVFVFLLIDLKKSIPVFLPNSKIQNREPISSLNDCEPAVLAHVLLALGKTVKTQKSINQLVQSILDEDLKLEYYDHKFFVYHHISRAYSEGLLDFIVLKDKIITEIINTDFFEIDNENELLNLLNLITLQNFGFTDFDSLLNRVHKVKNDFNYLKTYKYWTSKQRSWWAGSDRLTLALYIEFISNLKE